MKEVMEFCSLGGSEAEPEGEKKLKHADLVNVADAGSLRAPGQFYAGLSGNNKARWVSCPGQGESRRAQISTSNLSLQRAAGSFPPGYTGRVQAAQKGTSGVSSSPGTKPPSPLHFSQFSSFLPCFVPHRAQRSAQLYNSDNTKYSNKKQPY